MYTYVYVYIIDKNIMLDICIFSLLVQINKKCVIFKKPILWIFQRVLKYILMYVCLDYFIST